jgi:hypothetical protein
LQDSCKAEGLESKITVSFFLDIAGTSKLGTINTGILHYEIGKECSGHGRYEERIEKFGGKDKMKKSLGRSIYNRNDNIKMYLREKGWGGVWT